MNQKIIHNDLMLLANKEIANIRKDSSKPEKESMAKAIYF